MRMVKGECVGNIGECQGLWIVDGDVEIIEVFFCFNWYKSLDYLDVFDINLSHIFCPTKTDLKLGVKHLWLTLKEKNKFILIA